MQTFLSLIDLFTTALWLMLFVLAAWLYLSTHANPENFYTENDHRQGAYAQVDNDISTRECPGQRSGYDRIILIVNCENAARGQRVKRRRRAFH